MYMLYNTFTVYCFRTIVFANNGEWSRVTQASWLTYTLETGLIVNLHLLIGAHLLELLQLLLASVSRRLPMCAWQEGGRQEARGLRRYGGCSVSEFCQYA